MIKNVKYKNVYDGRKELYDPDTGEMQLHPKFKRVIVNDGFYQVYTRENEFMVLPKEFTLADRQILDYLCIMMNEDNTVIAPVEEVASRLSLSTKTVYRTIAALSKNDYIRKRTIAVFMVNPDYSTKTKGDKKVIIVAKYLELPCGKEEKKRSENKKA